MSRKQKKLTTEKPNSYMNVSGRGWLAKPAWLASLPCFPELFWKSTGCFPEIPRTMPGNAFDFSWYFARYVPDKPGHLDHTSEC
jgi:hypothetical protein